MSGYNYFIFGHACYQNRRIQLGRNTLWFSTPISSTAQSCALDQDFNKVNYLYRQQQNVEEYSINFFDDYSNSFGLNPLGVFIEIGKDNYREIGMVGEKNILLSKILAEINNMGQINNIYLRICRQPCQYGGKKKSKSSTKKSKSKSNRKSKPKSKSKHNKTKTK